MTDALNKLVLGRSAMRRALRRVIIDTILQLPLSRRLAAQRLSGIGIAYPRRSRSDHPLVGRRVPDVECDDVRLYEVLRSGRFVLVTSVNEDIRPPDWPGVDHARHSDPQLPAAMLVRPDGYVAWATSRPPLATELAAVLTRWCGLRSGISCCDKCFGDRLPVRLEQSGAILRGDV